MFGLILILNLFENFNLTFLRLSNLIVVISFPFVQEVIGINAFFIFAFLLFVFTVFVYFCMTETKNMTVEEIKTRYQYGILVKSSSQQSLII